MRTKTSRSEFEEWARDKVISIGIDSENNEYFWVDTQVAWEAWQAARGLQTTQNNED